LTHGTAFLLSMTDAHFNCNQNWYFT
jgi:hypothetical protein